MNWNVTMLHPLELFPIQYLIKQNLWIIKDAPPLI